MLKHYYHYYYATTKVLKHHNYNFVNELKQDYHHFSPIREGHFVNLKRKRNEYFISMS